MQGFVLISLELNSFSTENPLRYVFSHLIQAYPPKPCQMRSAKTTNQ